MIRKVIFGLLSLASLGILTFSQMTFIGYIFWVQMEKGFRKSPLIKS